MQLLPHGPYSSRQGGGQGSQKTIITQISMQLQWPWMQGTVSNWVSNMHINMYFVNTQSIIIKFDFEIG